jgi:hypothetical protein
MKQSPTADYPVRVRPESWEHDPTQAGLYAGVYTVTLNATVDITFVPDLSRSAPPWDGRIPARAIACRPRPGHREHFATIPPQNVTLVRCRLQAGNDGKGSSAVPGRVAGNLPAGTGNTVGRA